jgi:hypothetical protein
MAKYKEITIYKFKNGEIKYIGDEVFEITPTDKKEFPISYKVRKKDLFWEVFDNSILEDGLIIPYELCSQLDNLMDSEIERKQEFSN